MAVRRLANPVTLCDGHGVFFVAASGQIRMAANRSRLFGSAYANLLITVRARAYQSHLAGVARAKEGGEAARNRGDHKDRPHLQRDIDDLPGGGHRVRDRR